MSTLLALLSSLLWGASDFLGGTASRRLPPLAVIAWSEFIVLVGMTLLGLVLGDLRFGAEVLGWGTAAGVAGAVGLSAFYRALAEGSMGVVAPIAGLGVVVPVAVGVGLGERPDALQVVGMVVGVAGILLVSAGPERSGGRHVLLLAGVGAAGFGSCFVFIDRSVHHGLLSTLVVMRLATVLVMAAYWLVRRPSWRIPARDLPLVGLIGVLDVSANGSFGRATAIGSLAVVSVLSSLYPAVTALLARVVHDERLDRLQASGVGATIAAIVLLAAGPSG